MSSYHTSFTYLNSNSYDDYGLIISHFDNYDNGEIESYLSVDPVYHDSYNGVKRTLYGTKYNSVYTLNITVLNKTLDDFSIAQTRAINRWLTGAQSYSWMDLYIGDEVKCRLHCYVKDVKPYKIDARIIGFIITVESSSPWAYSPIVTRTIPLMGNKSFYIQCNDTDDRYQYIPMNITFKQISHRVVCFDADESVLEIRGKEINYNDSIVSFNDINVSYDNSKQIVKLNKEVNPTNKLEIVNGNTRNTTIIKNISDNEVIQMSDNMIIHSDKPSRIFGDDFNYIWPKLRYGINIFDATGDGDLKISYTTFMKIGDCIDCYKMLSGIEPSDSENNHNGNQNNNEIFTTDIFVRGSGTFECKVDNDGVLSFAHTHIASDIIHNK